MATLNNIATEKFTQTGPTRVEGYAINKYLVADDLFNLLEFVNIGQNQIYNMQATVLIYDKPYAASTRKIGEEYTVDNSTSTAVTLVLKAVGRAFSTDRILDRSMSKDPKAMNNWRMQQLQQAVNATKMGWTKLFIQGDSSSDAKAFDGLDKFFEKNAGQVDKTALDLKGGLTETNAIAVEKFMNTAIAKVVDQPTCVITTRLKGKPFLQTLEMYRHRGVATIDVNNRKYSQFMGMPIVALEDDMFATADTNGTNGIPFYFCKFAEQNGIRVAIPADNTVVDIIMPRDAKSGGGDSVLVNKGSVEILSVPFIVDPYCASKCYVKESPAASDAS